MQAALKPGRKPGQAELPANDGLQTSGYGTEQNSVQLECCRTQNPFDKTLSITAASTMHKSSDKGLTIKRFRLI